jgi:hypothetical protein
MMSSSKQPETKSPRVFISYAWEDSDFVLSLNDLPFGCEMTGLMRGLMRGTYTAKRFLSS